MQCPACGYMMSAFDQICPRCQGRGQQAPPNHPPAQQPPGQPGQPPSGQQGQGVAQPGQYPPRPNTAQQYPPQQYPPQQYPPQQYPPQQYPPHQYLPHQHPPQQYPQQGYPQQGYQPHVPQAYTQQPAFDPHDWKYAPNMVKNLAFPLTWFSAAVFSFLVCSILAGKNYDIVEKLLYTCMCLALIVVNIWQAGALKKGQKAAFYVQPFLSLISPCMCLHLFVLAQWNSRDVKDWFGIP